MSAAEYEQSKRLGAEFRQAIDSIRSEEEYLALCRDVAAKTETMTAERIFNIGLSYFKESMIRNCPV